MSWIRRVVMFVFAEKWSVVDDNVKFSKENRRLRYERDDALSLVADLQEDVAAVEQINRVLMAHAPSDASALFDQEEAG